MDTAAPLSSAGRNDGRIHQRGLKQGKENRGEGTDGPKKKKRQDRPFGKEKREEEASVPLHLQHLEGKSPAL